MSKLNEDEKAFNGLNAIRGHMIYRKFGKRLVDILFSGTALIILSPLLLMLVVLVRIMHGSPVFFTPTRPGKDEKIFKLYKFRTMSNATDKEGKLLPERERVTVLGKFMRATSLDEIPELFNIFKGDMSIVGPRPFAMKYLPYYSDEERLRHSVRPGLTGLAQISGRNNLPWPQRFEKDLEYVRDMSFAKDMEIIFGTAAKLFGDSDVTVPGTEKKYQFDTYRVIEEEGTVPERIEGLSVPEIGGQYWIEEKEENEGDTGRGIRFPNTCDSTFTLSGRAAIALALRDARAKKKIRRAYVPSYISFSMLQPFIQEEIEYKYYRVRFHRGKVKYSINRHYPCDVFLAVDYFGLDNSDLAQYVSAFRKKGCVVIKDITHSLLNDSVGADGADYYVASIRKWLAVPSGGWLGKYEEQLIRKPDLDSEKAVEKMKAAMLEKNDYINGLLNDKTQFLEKMSVFESDLVQLDPMLQIDSYSTAVLGKTDLADIRTGRKKNALTLYDRLSDLPNIRFLNTREQIETIVPFYLPILLEHDKRNLLRTALMKKGIYCPIHWPETMGAPRGVRGQVLSLVCDQRYDTNDMVIMADIIRASCLENRK